MQNEIINLQTVKTHIDLIDYIASLGYRPTRQNNQECWYLSPLRQERTASFKVDRNKQVWYDHGIGQGGDLIDFIKAYYHCDFREALVKIKEYLSIQEPAMETTPLQQISSKGTINTSCDGNNRIQIMAERPIRKPYLKQYIQSRGIAFHLASQYLKEVDYSVHGRTFTALGFLNDGGGYELRNQYFKGSYKPKVSNIVLLNEIQKPLSDQKLAVFEGFFSMLSFLELLPQDQLLAEKTAATPDTLLVLNSLSLLPKSRDLITAYGHIDLYLDNDPAGKKATQQSLLWSKNICDRSDFYEGDKDLNDYLCRPASLQKEQQKVPEEPVKPLRLRH